MSTLHDEREELFYILSFTHCKGVGGWDLLLEEGLGWALDHHHHENLYSRMHNEDSLAKHLSCCCGMHGPRDGADSIKHRARLSRVDGAQLCSPSAKRAVTAPSYVSGGDIPS